MKYSVGYFYKQEYLYSWHNRRAHTSEILCEGKWGRVIILTHKGTEVRELIN